MLSHDVIFSSIQPFGHCGAGRTVRADEDLAVRRSRAAAKLLAQAIFHRMARWTENS